MPFQVQSARVGIAPLSLMPSLRDRLETAISVVAETCAHCSPTAPPLQANTVVVAADDYDTLLALLQLHHLVLTTVAGVAEYRASIRSAPEVGTNGDEDPLDEDTDTDATPPSKAQGVSSNKGEDNRKGFNAGRPASASDAMNLARRNSPEGAPVQADMQARGGVPRRERIAAKASAVASAARTRLALMKAWRDVSEAGPAAQLQQNGSSFASLLRAAGERAEGAKGADVARRTTAESFLREACRRARQRLASMGGDGDADEQRRLHGGSLNAKCASTVKQGGVEGCLAGPLATPSVNLPRLEDVEKVVFAGEQPATGDPKPSSHPPVSEECLLCGAGMMDNDGAGGEQGGGNSVSSMGGAQDLPGWAVCLRGHRLRRCMDTLTPSLAIGYKRCEVCRCILELSSPADGGLSTTRGRRACVFCDVLLVSAAGMV